MTLDELLLAYRDGRISRDELRARLPPRRPAPDASAPPPSADDLRAATVDYLRTLLAGTLSVPATAIEPAATFDRFGIDSILSLRITRSLQQEIGELPASLLFECQTLDQLADYLMAHHAEGLATLVARPSSEDAPETTETTPQVRTAPAPFPLSEGQKGLWVEWRRSPASNAYNLALGFRILDMLHVDAFRKAFERLLSRHPLLTAVIEESGGVPMQRQGALSSLPFAHEYWLGRGLDEAVVHLNEVARAPFSLAEGPLVRLRILTLSPQDHVVLFAVHHVACDGASWPILLSTLLGGYDDFQQGRTPVSEAPPTPYREYVEWEEAFLASAEAEEHRKYWRGRLAGPLPVLAMPPDRPAAAGPMVADTVARSLGAALGARVRAESRAQRVSAATWFLAVFELLLHRYCGVDDVIVGVPTLGRPEPRFGDTVGYFVNMVPIRTEIDPHRPFGEFVRGVRDAMTEGIAHSAYPFPSVVRDLDVSRDRAAVFQVGYSYESTALFGGRGSRDRYARGLSIELVEAINRSGAFGEYELALEAREAEGDAFELAFKYDGRRFERETVERWMDHYLRLLEAFLGDPEMVLDQPELLSEAERRRVVSDWNATSAEYPAELRVHELVEAQVARTPSEVAVVCGDRSIRYDELNDRAEQLARYLRARGAGPDRVVAVCVDRTIELVVGILGVLKSGAAYLPIDPRYPRERRAYMLENAGPPIVLTDEALQGELPETSATRVRLDADWPEIARHDTRDVEDVAASPDDLAYVIYTSGSTGQPKGTAMPHRALVNLIEWHRRSGPVQHAQRTLQFAALGFDVAFQEIFSTLAVGGTLVLIPEAVRSDPAALVDVLREREVQRLFVPFSALQALAAAAVGSGAELDALEDVITAGERLRITPEIASFFRAHPGCRLHNHYGPTESHVVTAATLSGDPERWGEHPTIGRPIANARIYLLDPRRRPVPIGAPGEIYIGGVAVARGYLHRPELTEERFVSDPFTDDPNSRLYRTGDLARFRSDGEIDFLGRNDDQVKIRGFRVELGEIESQLRRHAAVKDAVVVVVWEGETAGARLIAYVTRDGDDSPEALRSWLGTSLPDFMLPSAFVTLEALPLTPNGKVDRRNLPEPDLDAFAVRKYEAPQGEVESALVSMWQSLLGVARVGRNDNFFDLGGHSLLAMQVIARLREEQGVELSPSMLFDRPTVAALAEYVGARVRSRDPASRQADVARNPRQRGVL